jgi:hypothetical protein
MMQRRWQDNEEVAALLEKAELQGFLMTEDIMEAYPDAQPGQSDVPRLLAFLPELGSRSSTPIPANSCVAHGDDRRSTWPS